MKKEGVSLITLGVTLIVMSILAVAVVMSLNNSIDGSKETGFATELKEITEGAQAYYLLNKELPVDKTASYTQTDLLGISVDAFELQNEFNLNYDTSATYYKIDLSLIASTSGLYGNGASTYDFYVISEDGNFVYYPLGVKVGENIYFSLTSKLTQVTDISVSESVGESVTSVTSTAKISAAKSTKDWTNALSISVNTELGTGETLYYVIGDSETQITDALPYTLELSSATNLNGKNEIAFEKKNSAGKVIAKTIVDLDNFDNTAPTIGETVIQKTNDYVYVVFTGATDDKSQIAKSYYKTDSTTYTATQLVESGTEGGTHSIKLDTSATYVQFVVVDNAGNVSAVKAVTIE